MTHYAEREGGWKMPMAGEEPAWRRVLRDVGYPEKCLILDFETYFDEDYGLLKKGGKGLPTIEYVNDPRFEILGLAYYGLGETGFVRGDVVGAYLAALCGNHGMDLGDITCIAQNANFDFCILAQKFQVYPKYVIDTLGLARAWNSRRPNGLADLCKYEGLKDKGNTADFCGMTYREDRMTRPIGRGKARQPRPRPLATPQQTEALAAYAINDVEREAEVFAIYLPRLCNPHIELPLMMTNLEMFTRPTVRVDYELAEELKGKMQAEWDAAIPPDLTKEEVSGDKRFEQELCRALEEAGDNPQRYYKPGKKKYNLALAKPDPERELLLSHSSERVRSLMGARIAGDSWPLHIGRIDSVVSQSKAGGGRLPICLKYSAAHTGRDSGGEGINPQNFGARGDDLVSKVREIIVPDRGHSFVIIDLAAIEARDLAYLAGQDDLVERFRKNEEIYCGFASKVLGYSVRKPRKSGGIPAIEQRLSWARNSIGKVGILGCGYGMGAAKAVGYAKGAIDRGTADKIVATYRAENSHIVQFWKDIERAFMYTFKYKRATELRGLRIYSEPECDVVVRLQSGRCLFYPRVRIGRDQYDREKLEIYNALTRQWEPTWGGSLTENIVQARCRDILMEAALRLSYRVVLRCHDELVIHTLTEQADGALAVGIREMTRSPAWAPGLPLAAEGSIKDRYCK